MKHVVGSQVKRGYYSKHLRYGNPPFFPVDGSISMGYKPNGTDLSRSGISTWG